jgi:multiple sugar transport system permease protein
VSFTNFDGLSPRWHFIGLRNYQEALTDPTTWYSLSRSFLLVLLVVPLSIAGGLGLALLLNQQLRMKGLLRTIFYLPSVVPVVSSAIMWKFIFDRDTGALNALTEHLGFPLLNWLQDPTAFYALIILLLWGLGGGMVISLAGLQSIPTELLECAGVEGASRWQVFRLITIPMLSPILFFQIVTGVIATFNVFIQAQLLVIRTAGSNDGVSSQGGMVPHSNLLYMVNVWNQFFLNQRFGYGSALLWILFLLVLGLTLVIFRSSSFWVYYEVEQDAQKGKQ